MAGNIWQAIPRACPGTCRAELIVIAAAFVVAHVVDFLAIAAQVETESIA